MSANLENVLTTAAGQYLTGTDPVTIGTQAFNNVGGTQIVSEQVTNLTGVVVTPENVSIITQLLQLIFGGA